MNHNLIIYTKCNNKNKLIIKLYELNVSIKNIKYNNNVLEFEISQKDYKRIKKYIKTYNFKIKKNKGIYYILEIIRYNLVNILNILLAIILIYIFSHLIINVEVIHAKKNIRELVSNSLSDNGIKKFGWKKDYDEIEKIKNKILKKYPDKIEWLEIEQIGMIYRVRIEEKILTNISKEDNNCHIIATKNGTITKILSNKGQLLVEKNDYVKEGDILISGEIKFNDEIKNNVCASGIIYANVWYTVNTSIPINYKEIKYTGKKRYNFMIDKTKIFKSRLKKYNTKKRKIFSIFGYEFYLLKEYEYKSYNKKNDVNDALKITENNIKDKMKIKLKNNGRIIEQKVLKNSTNNSTIDIESFVVVEEIISKQNTYIEEEKEVE